MSFRFDIRESLPKAIQRIARERIDRVIKSLSEKPKPGAESIHDARKDLKSLRALLRLSRGSMDEGVRHRANIFFRDAGRSLSTIRDPQALLGALKNLSKGMQTASGRSTPKQESMRAFISKIHGEIEQTLVNALPRELVRRLVRELRDAKRQAARWFEVPRIPPGNEWENFVGPGLRQTYRKAKKLVWQFEVMGRDKADDKSWHELRKCAKALGYQLRLFKPIWPELMDTLVEEIDQLTDRLGDANDLFILSGKILNKPYNASEMKASAKPRRVFLQLLDRRKEQLQSEAFEMARLIYAEKPAQFERRQARYWQIWRSHIGAKESERSATADAQARHQGATARKTTPEIAGPSGLIGADGEAGMLNSGNNS